LWRGVALGAIFQEQGAGDLVKTDDRRGLSFRCLLAVALVLAAALVPVPASSAPPFAPDCPIFPADNV
jgi:hypothetical protein